VSLFFKKTPELVKPQVEVWCSVEISPLWEKRLENKNNNLPNLLCWWWPGVTPGISTDYSYGR